MCNRQFLSVLLGIFILAGCNSTAAPETAPQPNSDVMEEVTSSFVVLKFDINKVGGVENIQIIDAKPKKVFNNAAIEALKKWKFKTKIVNGEPVIQKNQRIQLDFTLEEQNDNTAK